MMVLDLYLRFEPETADNLYSHRNFGDGNVTPRALHTKTQERISGIHHASGAGLLSGGLLSRVSRLLGGWPAQKVWMDLFCEIAQRHVQFLLSQGCRWSCFVPLALAASLTIYNSIWTFPTTSASELHLALEPP